MYMVIWGEAKRRASKSRQDFEESNILHVPVRSRGLESCQRVRADAGTWQGAVKCRLPSNRTASLNLKNFETRSAENVGRVSRLRGTKIAESVSFELGVCLQEGNLTPQLFGLMRHHFGSYMFSRPQVLLQKVRAEPFDGERHCMDLVG